MADDVSALTPTDGSPSPARPGGVASFSRGLTSPGHRSGWRRTGAVVAALVLLGGVGAAAALTGSGSSSEATPPVGVPRATVAPPEIVFTSATDGFVFYADCKRNLATDGCPPEVMHTTDAGTSWHPVTLPAGAPSTPSLWGQLQGSGAGLVLPWANGAFLLKEGGTTWTAPPVLGAASYVSPGSLVVDESGQPVVIDLARGSAAALAPTIPVTTPWATGTLAGDRVWIKDVHEFAVTTDNGRSWRTTLLKDTDIDVVLSSSKSALLARLQVPLAGTTLGVAGDGGEYPVESVLFSRDNGASWQRTPVSGPAVNGDCTVLLANGDLLGVAVDGSGLLRMPSGQRAFVPVSNGPRPVPSCLSNAGAGVYGPTFSNQYVTSPDGTTWRAVALPRR